MKLRTRVFDLEQQNRILSVLFQQRVKMSTSPGSQVGTYSETQTGSGSTSSHFEFYMSSTSKGSQLLKREINLGSSLIWTVRTQAGFTVWKFFSHSGSPRLDNPPLVSSWFMQIMSEFSLIVSEPSVGCTEIRIRAAHFSLIGRLSAVKPCG